MATRTIFNIPTVEIDQTRYEELVMAEHELFLIKEALLKRDDYTNISDIKMMFNIIAIKSEETNND